MAAASTVATEAKKASAPRVAQAPESKPEAPRSTSASTDGVGGPLLLEAPRLKGRHRKFVAVIVHRCERLDNQSWLGESDPYVKVKLEGASRFSAIGGNLDGRGISQTSEIEDDLNPTFDEGFVYLADDTVKTVKFEVWDSNAFFDSFIGGTEGPLPEYGIDGPRAVPVGLHGSIWYTVRVMPAGLPFGQSLVKGTEALGEGTVGAKPAAGSGPS